MDPLNDRNPVRAEQKDSSRARRDDVPGASQESHRTVKEWVRSQPMSGSAEESTRPAVLIAAFGGFEDASRAATNALSWIVEQVETKVVAELDPEDYYDFQVHRPSRTITNTGQQKLQWVGTTLTKFRTESGIDVLVALGGEPNLRWRSFVGEILTCAESLNVTMVATLHAISAQVPHTAPSTPRVTSASPLLQELAGAANAVEEGPAGIVSVLSETAWAAGLPVLDFWIPVPHYIAAPKNPKVELSFVAALDEHLGLDLATDDLRAEALEWEQELNEAASQDEQISDYVAQLEAEQPAGTDPEHGEAVDGDALAEELHRFLAGRDDGEDPFGRHRPKRT